MLTGCALLFAAMTNRPTRTWQNSMTNPETLQNRPIGVFDSGVGGLTVVRALMERLPLEHLIYYGDTARVPLRRQITRHHRNLQCANC